MAWLRRIAVSHIGRKVVVALTGLGLVGFLIVHLEGNLALFSSDPSGFDNYSHELRSQWFLPILEWGLLLLFVAHIAVVAWLVVDNRRARGGGAYKAHGTKQSRWIQFFSSKTMPASGLLVLGFIVVHLADFRFRLDEMDTNAEGVVQLHQEVYTVLSDPVHAALYFAASLAIGWHLFHGIQSAARSLGVYSPKWTPIIERAGTAIAALIGVGFAVVVAYVFFA